jgi:hypothetical protein
MVLTVRQKMTPGQKITSKNDAASDYDNTSESRSESSISGSLVIANRSSFKIPSVQSDY